MIDGRTDSWHRYQQGEERLLDLIRGERGDSPSRDARLRRAASKLERTREFLKHLGEPQRGYPVVHVTGTSGKGSTCAAVAAILTAAGYRVGLRTSPFVQVATEKLQLGPSLIDALEFADQVDRVLATDRRFSSKGMSNRPLSYAEAWTALSFRWFAEREVDVAVVEVGAGGRFDATNVVEPVVSVITSVGLDHVVSLGPTLADIAWHKAGIIKSGSIAVVGNVPEVAWEPIVTEANRHGVAIMRPESSTQPDDLESDGPIPFQHANGQLARTVCAALRTQGFAIADAAVAEGIARFRMPARYEPMPGTYPYGVWIDGAHNRDKIDAVLHEVLRNTTAEARPVVLLGMMGSKDATSMVMSIGRIAQKVVTTQYPVRGKQPYSAAALAECFRKTGFVGAVEAIPDPDAALGAARTHAAESGVPLLVTGSLYLAGRLRRHWYPNRAIVAQRTPWPAPVDTER